MLICTPCNDEFRTISGFRQHLRCHIAEGNIFPCPHNTCYVTFPNKRRLKIHIESIHIFEYRDLLFHINNNGKYRNDVTIRYFSAFSDFFSLLNINNPIQKNLCFKCFKYSNDIKIHSCSTKVRRYINCPCCGNNIYNIKKHLKKYCERKPCKFVIYEKYSYDKKLLN